MNLFLSRPYRLYVLALGILMIASVHSFSQSRTPSKQIESEIAGINKSFLNAVQQMEIASCNATENLPVDDLLKKALLYNRRGNWHCCRLMLDTISKCQGTLTRLQLCHFYLACAEYFSLHQYYDSAKLYATLANNGARSANWKNETVQALLILSTGGLRQRNISSAYAWADSALVIARQTGNETLEGKALLQVGLCARRHFTAVAKRSFPYFLMAREKALATKDSLALGTIDLYLGTDDFEVAKWDEGLSYFKEGIELSLRNQDYYHLYLAHIALGYTFQLQNRLEEAVILFTKALSLAQGHRGAYDVQHCYHDLARCYQGLRQYDSALKYANLAGSVKGVDSLWANVWDTKATIYEDMDDYKMAATMYKKSVDWYREDFMYRNQDQLSGYEATLNTKEKELQVTEQKKRSLQLEWMIVGIGGLLLVSAFAFVVQRKARGKLLLQNALIQKQQKALEEALSEKEILLKEIHHRVKNNLSVVSSLLELQSAGMTDEKAKAAITVGQNRVASIALIHQRLYQHENLAAIELGGFLKDLIRQVNSVFQQPGVRVQIEQDIPQETVLDIDTAVPLGLILNELLTNSYKYAFGEDRAAKITIDLAQPRPGEYVLTYTDNGPGIAEEKYKNSSASLGLRLIRRLSSQLGGSATYAYRNGCRFTICFKDANTRKLEA